VPTLSGGRERERLPSPSSLRSGAVYPEPVYSATMLVLLFTDLESSTRLWEQHPSEMRPALARHDAILRDAVAGHGGRIVKTTGDGLMATFSSVGDCLASCLEAQRTLGQTSWETGEPLKVRMGLNVGEAESREGDFFGTAVNRAARIMAAGHGGQVLLSALAAQLGKDSLPAGVTLRDLGAHRLKDLTQPEQLYQLVDRDLGSDFPPLNTLDARPNNLPIQVSEFFGREVELSTARGILEAPGVRLLTLTGPGGTGKTRLSLQLAAELVDRYRDGAFLADLAAERDPESAFEAILRDLGIASTREGSPLQILKTKLADRNMLIVLDNFEQVTEAAVGVAEILAGCPDVDVVVTSREALRVRGEHVMSVAPLTLPDPRGSLASIGESDAVNLFVDRARSARADFALTADNAAAVAEISVRLDGLPLAIELAAARLSLFSAGDLLERLRRQLDVLGSGARDLPARQRTLRSTIEWSYELLDPDECRVFQLMSVFSTARLEAVEVVATAVYGDLDTLDVVASLVDKSLLRSAESGGSQRFSMLQTIREYAAERLAAVADEADAARRAHARYFAEHARVMRRELDSTGAESILEDVATELGDMRTAWQYWVDAGDIDQLRLLLESLWVLHDARGWHQGIVELMTDFVGLLEGVEPSPAILEEEMTARTGLGRALMAVRGYTLDADEQFRRVLELSGQLGASAKRLPVLRALSTYHMYLTDFPTAAAIGREILDQAERGDEPAALVEGHLVFGVTTAMSGDLETGLPHLEEAIRLFDPEMQRLFRGGASPGVVARNAGALLLRRGGWPERARARAHEGLALSRALNHQYSLAYALHHTGLLALQSGRFEEAETHTVELAEVARVNDWPIWRALASVTHGVALCGMGRPEEGLVLTEAGNEVYRGMTTPPVFWPGILGLRSLAFGMAGEFPRAVELADEAIVAAGGEEAYFPDLRVLRGHFASLLPTPDAAAVEESYRAAIRGAGGSADRMTELAASTRLVSLLRTQGRDPDESAELERRYLAFSEGHDEPELVAARAVLSEGA